MERVWAVSFGEKERMELERVVLEVTGLKVQMKVEEFELEEIYMKYFEGSGK